ncbi:Serine/threonine protein kinase [Streptosporangium subroseum]|uniref:non-specific serine/threonine protein kinase n=1 Tax=Streptosporangium subroseum TaxID=106412 RepID=A0A239FPY5_9ACTN|nr:PASTA domain-containing protein [Streptosporangium subroseum]SNS58889.1 Serine/threonine protein kinase [Streptosporangium subroseum]
MPYAQPLKTGDPARLGEYEIVGRLGEGGQGVVYVGVRPETGPEPYAVKLLHGPVGDEQEVFLREVELAKQVARFCTAQVIDAGLDGDRPYIVSEYVDGPSLHREVAVSGPREGGALERLAIGTATALSAIHRAGIVHRDFKPQNVLLGPDGPRVIDFGLARALDAAATQSGRGAGTPAYMAPEQVKGAEINPAADVFSWGATMCFAANAHAPFGQDSIAAVLHRILTASPELGRLDGLLGLLVADCLAKDPRNRPTSRELLLALLDDDDGRWAGLRSPSSPSIADMTVPPARSTPAASSQPVRLAKSAWSAKSVRFAAPAASATSARSAWSVRSAEFARSGESNEPRTYPGRAATRASVAVSGALLVSAAVLVGVLVPALSGDGGVVGDGQTLPVVETSAEAETTPPTDRATRPARPSQRAEGPSALLPPRVVPATSAPAPSPGSVPVPVLVGLDRSEALRLIKRAGLVAGTATSIDSDQRVGQVLSSRPEAGATVKRGTRVDFEFSAGVRVPELAGLRRRPAEAALTAAGLTTGGVTVRCSTQPGGQVLASTPGAGSQVSSGSAVALVVSKRGAEVPSVIGQSSAAASSALSGAGFAVRTRPRLVDDPSKAGVVLSQNVAPGTCAQPGATVAIVVGVEGQSGPGPGPGPDPGSGPGQSTATPGSAGPQSPTGSAPMIPGQNPPGD